MALDSLRLTQAPSIILSSVIFKGIMFSRLYFLVCYICLSAAETHEQQTAVILETNVHIYVLILALSILSPELPACYLILRESVLYFYRVTSLNTFRDCILLKGKQHVVFGVL